MPSRLSQIEQSRLFGAKLDRLEAEFTPVFRVALARQYREALAVMRSMGVRFASDSMRAFTEPMEEAFAAVHGSLFLQEARLAYLDVSGQSTQKKLYAKGVDDYVDAWRREAAGYLSGYGGDMVGTVGVETLRRLRKILAAGTEEGLTVSQIASRIEAAIPDMTKLRARRIARTEVLSAINRATLAGALAAAYDMGVGLKKVWFTNLDGRERDQHHLMNGVTVEADEPFVLPSTASERGGEMMHPGDGSLGAYPESIINCRCGLTFEVSSVPMLIQTA